MVDEVEFDIMYAEEIHGESSDQDTCGDCANLKGGECVLINRPVDDDSDICIEFEALLNI
jgi:hypothetical protein